MGVSSPDTICEAYAIFRSRSIIRLIVVPSFIFRGSAYNLHYSFAEGIEYTLVKSGIVCFITSGTTVDE